MAIKVGTDARDFLSNPGGTDLSKGWKSNVVEPLRDLGRGPDPGKMPDVEAPAPVAALASGPSISSAPTVGGPQSFQGARIGSVADPRAALIEMGAQNQFRDQQMGLAQSLAQQAAGQGPSLATQMHRQGQEAATSSAFAQMASQRGGPNAMGARSAMQNASQIAAQSSRDAANARIQEQLAAREQLAGVVNAGRAADINVATSQAQMQQEAQMAAYKGQLETAIAQGQIDQQTASQMFQAAQQKAQQDAQLMMQFEQLKAQYAGMGLDAARANQMAAIEIQRMRQGAAAGDMAAQSAASAQKQAMWGSVLGAAATVGGAAVGRPAGATVAPAVAGAAAPAAVAATTAPGAPTNQPMPNGTANFGP